MSDFETDPMMDLFRLEMGEQSTAMVQGLAILSESPDNPAPLDDLVGAARSMRGAARIVGREVPARLASALEELFAAAQAGRIRLGENDLELCLRAGAEIARLAEPEEPENWDATAQAFIEKLAARTSATAPPAPVAPPSPAATRPAAAVTPEPKAASAPPAPAKAPSAVTLSKPRPAVEPASTEFTLMADPSMLELFREEVRTHTGNLNAGILELEREPGNPQRIEPLMRAAHSLKGASRIVGLDPAVRLAHDLEDAFVAAQSGRIRLGAAEIDVCLKANDLLAAIAEEDLTNWARSRFGEVHELREVIASIARGEGVGSTADEPLAPAATETAQAIAQPSESTVAPPSPPPITEASSSAPSTPASSHGSAEQAEPVVRVTAQSLNRLMSLAGESLVQARWLQPFASALLQLKKHQDSLTSQLDALVHGVSSGEPTDALASSVGDARRQATLCQQVLMQQIGAFEDHAGAAEDLNSRLYREVIVSRMRPFADGTSAFPRLVRDTARKLGKQARLQIEGQTTEVDRDILEKLEAPLTHLLRNAVDHGLEETDGRVAAGKPAEGLIRIEARHRAGMLAITVSDDGRGVDAEKIRKKVLDRRLATPEMAERMTEAELLEFLFLPGFSTAGQVTEVSGRGVGLDVVQDTVRKVGGSVKISTKLGQGTSFHLQLPITLSVVRAVLVEIAGEPYAFPHNRIDRLLMVPREEIASLEHRQFANVDGRNVGLVLAAQLLDLPGEPPLSGGLPVVLLSDSSGSYGLIVEAFLGEQDLVVRPLDPRLGKVPNVSASAILDDGSPVLLADVEDLIRSMDQYIQSGTLRRCEERTDRTSPKKRILVVDDSITVREVQRQILRTNGYEVEVAVDGQDGWNRVRAEPFDLVISDVDMPRMTGLEFVRKIRDEQSLRNLPVVIVSYKDRGEDRIRGMEAGANHYLTKSSFHDHTFLDAVASLIGKA